MVKMITIIAKVHLILVLKCLQCLDVLVALT